VPPLPEDAPRVRVGAPSYNPDQFAETSGHVTLVGSRRDCQLCVPLGDISKLHCAICNTGRELLICDLRSRTGTFVNDQNVLAASLRRDDSVRIGNIPLELEFVRRPRGSDSGEKPKLAHVLRLVVGGETFSLETQPIVFGRRSNCDVVVDTPDVSLAHSLIFLVSGCPVIYDLGSRSGTLVNGRRVNLAWLKDGDRLGIGGETLLLGWEGPTFSPAPAPVPAPAAAAASRGRDAAEFDLSTLVPGAGSPDTLEQTIAALQGQLSGFRGRLDKRAAEVEQRAAELEAQTTEMARQRTALESLREQLAVRAEHTDQERRLVLRRREKLRGAIESYRKHREALESRKAEVQRAAESVAHEKRRVEELERELAAREGALAQAAGETAQRERRATELEESVRKLERELAEREQSFRQREQAFAQQESTLLQRERETQQREGAIETARLAVTQMERDLKVRGEDLAIREQELNDHQATLAALEESLLQRQGALQSEEAGLQRRREAVAESERRIAQLKAALERAAQAFSGMTVEPSEAPLGIAAAPGGTGAPAVSPPAKCEAPISPQTEGRSMSTSGAGPQATPVVSSSASIAAIEARGNGDGSQAAPPLPAPIVDQPIFAGLPTLQQLPQEMQERVRVLRRVSDRSEAELVAQVLAESDARQQSEAAAESSKSKKKRRGWLS